MLQKPNSCASRLSEADIEERFRRLTLLMYDTSVSLSELQEQVYPYLSKDIRFVDPFIRARGRNKFQVGLRGFHCAFLFDFRIDELRATLNERGDGGRVIVDGVMNLRSLRVYSYPLRTILVYEFVLTQGGCSLEITSQEEMWSVGDLAQNAPVLGPLYDGWRFLSGYFFTAMFWLSCALATRLPWARHYRNRLAPKKD